MKGTSSLSLLRQLLLLLAVRTVPLVEAFTSSSSFVGTSLATLQKQHQHQQHHHSSSRHHGGRHTTHLSMMFDQLSSAISTVTKQFGPKKRMTEQSIQPALRDVRRALLDADVNIQVADTLIDGVKKRTLGTQVLEGVSAEQQFVKAMYDELLDMMGGDSTAAANQQQQQQQPTSQAIPAATLYRPSSTTDRPAVVLLAGLQGAGKTTAAGKLALYLKEREVDLKKVQEMPQEESSQLLSSRMPKTERKVLLVAADVYRPAAIQQLEILGKAINVEVYSEGTDADPVEICKNALTKAMEDGYDTVVVDTAGRQVIDTTLMKELENIKEAVQADETLLVCDAMTGQEAASLTASFDNAVGISGAILTKLDGDSRGGAAVSIRGVSGKPIKFVGTGEKTEDLEPFYPDRMASRILGMGDVISLVEKAAAEVSDADALKMQQKMLDANFDFDDFMKQSKLVAKMGSLAGVAKMLPGMGDQLDSSKMKEVEGRLKKSEAMICSMTKKERANPDLLIKDSTARSRLMRITKGSGMLFEDGMNFMSEFQKMRTMMSRMQKQMAGGGGGDPAALAADGGGGAGMPMGNRQARRAAKKKKKTGRGGGGGFG